MSRVTFLAMALHAVIGTTFSGSAMIAALTLGYKTAQPLVLAAVAGFIVAIPVSWLVAKRIAGSMVTSQD